MESVIRTGEPPNGTPRFEISSILENTTAGVALAKNQLIPALLKQQPVLIDFGGVTMVTQGFVHSLLFLTVRIAWAMQTHVYVKTNSKEVLYMVCFVEKNALS